MTAIRVVIAACLLVNGLIQFAKPRPFVDNFHEFLVMFVLAWLSSRVQPL